MKIWHTGLFPDKCGLGVTVTTPTNLYGCTIGNNVFIGPFCEIQKNAMVGDDTRVQSHTFICEAVHIGKRCFVGHGVMFINDKNPRANNSHWHMEPTIVEDDVSIGSGATILPVRLGRGCVVGAGAVVTKDVPPRAVVVGNPARILRYKDEGSDS